MSAVVERKQHPYSLPPLLGGLTLRQFSFVDHYIQTQNATESARLAGYPQTERSLWVTGHRLLRSAKVQAELRRRFGKHILSADEVLESLSNHARSDIADVLEPDGSFDLKAAKRRGKSKLLRKLKVKQRYEKDADGNITPVIEHEFELHDAQAALNTLAKYHGLLIERSESVNLNVSVERQELVVILESALGGVLDDAIDITPERVADETV
jgi:hypothetical protein